MRTIEQIRAEFEEVERLRGNVSPTAFQLHIGLAELGMLLDEIERLSSRSCRNRRSNICPL